jgi:hypothetical protein
VTILVKLLTLLQHGVSPVVGSHHGKQLPTEDDVQDDQWHSDDNDEQIPVHGRSLLYSQTMIRKVYG